MQAAIEAVTVELNEVEGEGYALVRDDISPDEWRRAVEALWAMGWEELETGDSLDEEERVVLPDGMTAAKVWLYRPVVA